VSPTALVASVSRTQLKEARKDLHEGREKLRQAEEKLSDMQRHKQHLKLKAQELAAALERNNNKLKRLRDAESEARTRYANSKATAESQQGSLSVADTKLTKMHFRDKARARRMLKMLVHLERQISHHFKVAEAITQAKEAIKKETEYWTEIHKTMVEAPKLKRTASDAADAAANAQISMEALSRKAERTARTIAELTQRSEHVGKKLSELTATITATQTEVERLRVEFQNKKAALIELRKQRVTERGAKTK